MKPYVSDIGIVRKKYQICSEYSIKDICIKNMSTMIKKNENDNNDSNNNNVNSINNTNDGNNISHNQLMYNSNVSNLAEISSSNAYQKVYKKILLIEKYTKYDNLKKQGYKDDYILRNFFTVYISHFTHTLILNNIINLLKTKYQLHVTILKAYKRNIENIFIDSSSGFSPDAIFSVGGDGTYLESAHIIANKYVTDANANIKNKRIELVGINSDPKTSEGKLCLNYFHLDLEEDLKYCCSSFKEFERTYVHKRKKKNLIFTDVSNFIKQLKKNKANDILYYNKNIKNKQECTINDFNTIEHIVLNNSLSYDATLKNNYIAQTKNDNNLNDGFENSNNKINDNDTVEKKGENKNKEKEKQKEILKEECIMNMNKISLYNDLAKYDISENECENSENICISVKEYVNNILRKFFETNIYKKLNRKYITVCIKKSNDDDVKTYKSVNEIYMYEAVKNNICTYINVDNKIVKRLKSTAILITSGTGSTAWAYNVNKLDRKKLNYIIKEYVNLQSDLVKNNLKNINVDLFSEYINNSICFHPSSNYMKCIIKEPVENSVYDLTDHIYTCQYLDIKTCTGNTIVYIDGIYNIKIQPNDSVILYIKDDDFIASYK
ncbi:conserved protein, unknown function [Hepatocystis sp. ex Piliocolobus tephrosceles]|nr:conserved protein, unknown function [Hepatocystis sp. ex Piliocolobus tephrosceles]